MNPDSERDSTGNPASKADSSHSSQGDAVSAKVKDGILRAARNTALALRDAAERLEAAASTGDFARLSETSLTLNVWSIDQIKGAALVIVRAAT